MDSRPRFPFPVPSGWFAVAFADELARGALKSLSYFGRELVLFRGENGAAHVHAKRIPPTARMRAWPVLDHSGVIFVWHEESGAVPDFELPPHPELSDPDWLPVERHEFTIATCAQEVAENAHDPAHFTAVHGVPALPDSKSEFEGPRLHSENRGKLETPRGPVETSIRATSYGLGVGHLRTHGLADMAQLLLQTPIDAEHLHVRWQFAVPRAADGSPQPLGVAFAREFVRQFGQDIPIWESKRYLARPLLCDGDGAIAGFRRWAAQFYASNGPSPAA